MVRSSGLTPYEPHGSRARRAGPARGWEMRPQFITEWRER